MGVFALGASVCFLDGYMKCKPSGADGKRSFTSHMSFARISMTGFLEDCVDLGSLLRIQAIIMPICLWSLYYSLINQKNTVSGLDATIETLEKDTNGVRQMVSRYQAKNNLHQVR